MDKKSIIGLVLIFAIFVGYMFWVAPSKEEMAEMQRRHDSVVAAYNDSVEQAALLAAEQARLDSLATEGDTAAQSQLSRKNHADMGAFNVSATGEETMVQVNTDNLQMQFSSLGARVSNVTLTDYTTFDSLPLQLVANEENNMNLVFSTEDNRVVNTKDLYFQVFVGNEPYNGEPLMLSGEDSLQLCFRAAVTADSNTDGEHYLEFVYTLHGSSYEVDFDINFHGLSNVVRRTPYMDFTWKNTMNRQEKVDRSARGSRNRNKDPERFNSNVYFKPVKDKVDNLKLGRDDNKQVKTQVKWVAYKQQFFAAILVADNYFENADLSLTTDRSNEQPNYLCDMGSVIGLTYESDHDCTIPMNFYFGPTKYRDLRSMHQGFERMLPLGWGFFLTQWISRYVIIPVFNFLERFNWNYGIIIIVLTFLLRLVLFPVTFKSYQGSAIMRILKPEMDALNKKYPNQDQAMQKQQEMSKIQKKAGYSPMAGCLPALVQLPILWAMFRFYPAAIELRQKPFLWCDDLSTYDSILDFGFNVPLYGDHISLFCLLMFAVQMFYTWYSMKATGSQMNMPGMKLMMYFMPFMMLFLFNSQSAALNLYYLCSLSITMAQMILIRKFTSEKKVRARMAAYDASHKNKPQKKSNFQKRLEEMQRMSEEMQRQQKRK